MTARERFDAGLLGACASVVMLSCSASHTPDPTPLTLSPGDAVRVELDVPAGASSVEATVSGPLAEATGPFEIAGGGHRVTGHLRLVLVEGGTDVWLTLPFVGDADGAPNDEPRLDTARTALATDGLRGLYLGAEIAPGAAVDVEVPIVIPDDVAAGPIVVSGWLRTDAGSPRLQVELEDPFRGDQGGFYVSRGRSVYSGDGYAVVPGAQEGEVRTETILLPPTGDFRAFVRQIAAEGDVRAQLSLGGDLEADLVGTAGHTWVELGVVAGTGQTSLALTPIGAGRLGLDALVVQPVEDAPPAGSGIDALGSAIDPAAAGESLVQAMSARVTAAPEDPGDLPRALRDAFGLEPLPVDVPASEVVEVIDDGPCDLELLWFDGGFGPVPANLYVPRDAAGPMPAILNPIGHWAEGKAKENEQLRAAAFCRLGFVSMTFDTFAQGERTGEDNDHFLGVFDALDETPFPGMLVGESVRAVSLLASRPEVDPDRIGVTGASGGGLVSAYLAAIDDRIAASAPVVYTTDYEWLVFESMQGDPCQTPFGAAHLAPLPALWATIAPRPLLFISAAEDGIFPERVARRVFGEIEGLYAQAGAAGRVQLEVVPGGHGYGLDARRLAYDFFLRELAGQGPAGDEPEVEPRSAEELAVHPPGLRSLAELHRDRTGALAGAPDREVLARTLRLPEEVPGGARLVDRHGNVSRWALDVDGGREVSAAAIGDDDSLEAVVIVADGGMAGSTIVPWLARSGRAVVLVEPTGIATQAGPYRGPRAAGFGNPATYLGGHPLLFGLTGMALLRAEAEAGAALARELGAVRVILCGEGRGSGGAALAIAAASDAFDAVIDFGGLASYREAAHWGQVLPPALMARRLFALGDLPDLASLLGSRPVLLLGIADRSGRAMPRAEVLSAYAAAMDAGVDLTTATADEAPAELEQWLGLRDSNP